MRRNQARDPMCLSPFPPSSCMALPSVRLQCYNAQRAAGVDAIILDDTARLAKVPVPALAGFVVCPRMRSVPCCPAKESCAVSA